MAEKRVRWGILGAGLIAHRFARSLAHDPASELVAISCRSAAKAAAFAEEHGVAPKRAYADDAGTAATPVGAEAPARQEGSALEGHAKLLADSDVDAIYLALPHGLHRAWACAALRAGKAVLCEKPAALTAGEMRAIASVARETGALFMEAQKARFVPAYARVRELLGSGAIGGLRRVETSLCNRMTEEQLERSYMLDPVQGGVALDCGIYCASWIDDFLSGTPSVRSSLIERYRGVDAYVRAELAFDASEKSGAVGQTALLECAFDRQKPRHATLVGEKGRIVVDDLHRSQRVTLVPDGGEPRVYDEPYLVDDFFGEIAHFSGLVRVGAAESPVMPLAASVRCAEILDAVRAG